MDGAERVSDYFPYSPPTPFKLSGISLLRKKPQGPLGYRCDGSCGTMFSYADDINVCKDCLRVQFCSNCLDLLYKGDLTNDLCDQKHEF